ncbi:Hypothetical protein NTJ_02996 [Nesidiocoris tenuis]|uniref:Uncharacterized protein n=1 Tax=Nesidiocoris tenuis TaxID=355587 RepID=A0ABN7ADW4_9HEMI|nr:Hypothetical protein NTJ_02996 [Nesidiocoris tenuis]
MDVVLYVAGGLRPLAAEMISFQALPCPPPSALLIFTTERIHSGRPRDRRPVRPRRNRFLFSFIFTSLRLLRFVVVSAGRLPLAGGGSAESS